MADLLPYANVGETISAEFDYATVPFERLGENSVLIDPELLTKPLMVDIIAQVPKRILKSFPDGERASPPLKVIAAYTSIDGSLRDSVELNSKDANLFAGSIAVDPKIVQESIKVTVLALRDKPGKEPGYASHNGARLGWCPTHEIRFKEKVVSAGNFLEIRWENFEGSLIVPEGYAQTFYYLDANASAPILYLNKNSVPALIKLMDTKGHSGSKASARDLLFRSIATSVWQQLLRAALDDLREEAMTMGTPVDLDMAIAEEWKRVAIRKFAEHLEPTLLPDAALLQICSDIDNSGYYTDLVSRAGLAAQSVVEAKGYFEKFAEEAFKNG